MKRRRRRNRVGSERGTNWFFPFLASLTTQPAQFSRKSDNLLVAWKENVITAQLSDFLPTQESMEAEGNGEQITDESVHRKPLTKGIDDSDREWMR